MYAGVLPALQEEEQKFASLISQMQLQNLQNKDAKAIANKNRDLHLMVVDHSEVNERMRKDRHRSTMKNEGAAISG